MFYIATNKWFLFLITVCLSASCSFIQADENKKRVMDDAAVLTEAQEDSISLVCAELESNIGSQIVVYTIKSLNNEPINEFANRTFNAWGIGRKNYNDGILIVCAVDDRNVRIEVGYGLENIITDVIARNIIDEEMVIHFKENEFYEGLLKAVVSIKKHIEANPKKIGERVH